MSDTTLQTIYIYLLVEGVDVWRPVEAEKLPDGSFRILSANEDPSDEHWEFPSGSVVACELRELSESVVLVAVGLAGHPA